MKVRLNSKSTAVLAVAGCLAVGLGLMGSQQAPAARPSLGVDEITESSEGLAISPVPINLQGKNAFMVGLGSYIVNAQGACSGCHTNPEYVPGGSPFLGQPAQANKANFLAGGRSFGPGITSRNLTPEPANGNLPAGMTLPQFAQVMRTGIDLDKAHPQISPLLQVMPWPTFGRMSDRDLTAVYEYLSSIPAATAVPPGH